MALFGKKTEQDAKEQYNERLRQERTKELLSIVSKKKALSVAVDGVVVFSENSDGGDEYIFYIENNEYRFMPYYGAQMIKEEELEQAAGREEIILSMTDTNCRLLDNNAPSPEEIDKRDGLLERQYKENKVKICFYNDSGKEFIVIVKTLRDVSKMPHFFMKLGVKNFYNVIDLDPENFPVSINNGAGLISNKSFFATRQKNELVLARLEQRSNRVYVARIPVRDIVFYKREGSIHYEQQISGGGGGGVNYKGAVVGGLLFGAAGAIVGSQRGTEQSEISSKTVTHDNRAITLLIKKDETLYSVNATLSSELAFDWLIPEKEYYYVIAKRRDFFENNKED